MHRLTNLSVVLLFALAAISGGLGGCAVSAQQFLSEGGAGKTQMRCSWVIAYGLIGVMFGLLFAAFGWVTVESHDPFDVIGPSVICGFVGASALGGVNTTARFLLSRLGIEVEVNVKRKDEGPKL